MKQKRILSVQDISCFGKCSNTVALPILSAAGVETAILPTALLSTHTGGFTGYTFLDLTEEMRGILAHFDRADIRFDMLYTGYFGSVEQLQIYVHSGSSLQISVLPVAQINSFVLLLRSSDLELSVPGPVLLCISWCHSRFALHFGNRCQFTVFYFVVLEVPLVGFIAVFYFFIHFNEIFLFPH